MGIEETVKDLGWVALKDFLKPRRSDSEVYISKCIDVTELVKYMKEKKKDNEDLTYFHLFSTAVAKVVYNKPLLNRFIIGGNKYDRNDITNATLRSHGLKVLEMHGAELSRGRGGPRCMSMPLVREDL